MKSFLLCMAATAAALIAGCSTNVVKDPTESPRLAELGKQEPSRLKLVIAAVEDARPKPTTLTAASDPNALTTAPVPQFDPVAFRAEMVKALEAARAFDRIRISDEKDVLRDAYANRDDLVLKLRVAKYDVGFIGYEAHRARLYASLALWSQLVFPAWWVADEEYACTLKVEATLVGVGSERALGVMNRKVYAAHNQAVLDDFERGVGFWPTQGEIDEDEWLAIAAVTAPLAREEVAVALADDLKKKVRADADEMAARYAVAIGAGHIETLPAKFTMVQAEEDAKDFHELLVERGGVPRKNAGDEPIISGAATKSRILTALRLTALRTRAQDLMFVFFAGFGATFEGTPLLVTANFDPARPRETGIPIQELADCLDLANGRVVLIVDASFVTANEPYLRTLALPGLSVEGPRPDAFKALKRGGRVCILSAGPTGLARTIEQGNGNFTAFLLEEAQSPEARIDARGFVTLNSIFDRVRANTAAAFDPPQEPLWISTAAGPEAPGEMTIPLARARARGARQ